MNFGDKRIYCLCIAIVLIATAVGSVILKNLCFSITTTICSIDPLLDIKLSEHLKEQIVQDITTPRLNLHKYAYNLKEQYSFIDAVQITVPTAKRAHITVHACCPLFCVNKQLVLLDNGSLVNRTIYNTDVVNGLHLINLAPTQVDPAILQWLTKQDFSVINQFAVFINTPTEIVLQKKDTRDQIICGTDHLITQEIIDHALTLCNERKPAACKKTQDGWICDVRFAGHLVLYKNKGKGSV